MSKLLNWQFRDTSIRETSSGGKAGKGCNRTASFMVSDHCFIQKLRSEGRTAGRYFSFTYGDRESRLSALREALRWCAVVDPEAKNIVAHGDLMGWWRKSATGAVNAQ